MDTFKSTTLALMGTSTCQLLSGNTTKLAKIQKTPKTHGRQFHGTGSKEADSERCPP